MRGKRREVIPNNGTLKDPLDLRKQSTELPEV
jgi:hypothetical protein